MTPDVAAVSSGDPTTPTVVMATEPLAALFAMTQGSDDKFVATIVDTYIDQALAMVSLLDLQIATADFASIRSCVHQLKSNSAQLGALRVSACAAALELAVHESETETGIKMQHLAIRLQQAVREAVPELRATVARLGAARATGG